MNLNDIRVEVRKSLSIGSKVGFIAGNFDLTHGAHYDIFRRAKSLCDFLIVAINSDEFSTRYKRKPILTYIERYNNVNSCKWVDLVVPNSGDEDTKVIVEEINKNKGRFNVPDNISFIFHGSDWIGDSLKKQMGFTDKWLEEQGITMVYLDNTKGISTTDIINRIKTSK